MNRQRPENQKVSDDKMFRKFWLISLLVVVALPLLYWGLSTLFLRKPAEHLFLSYFEADSLLNRGVSEALLADYLGSVTDTAYSESGSAAALAVDLLISGIQALNTNELMKAEAELLRLYDRPGSFNPVAAWYLALTYLRAGNLPQMRYYLKELVVTDAVPYAAPARKLLRQKPVY